MDAPKLFISYSWSSPDHEAWVIKLASDLVAEGIDVILDKWTLKEGQDANAFMERMVNDPSVHKVAIISDETYAKKADGRSGGVGTETQIISAEVYGAVEQTKFVVVLPSLDEAGKPFVPTFARSRIYIDLSSSERMAENLEQLVRWVYDKPLHVRPPLGKRPAYLDGDTGPQLGSRTVFRRATEAMRTGREGGGGALDDALGQLAEALPQFALAKPVEGPVDDAIVATIERMAGVRAEFEELVTVACRFSPTEESGTRLHRFFERILPLYEAQSGSGSYGNNDFDAYRFLGWELFLAAVAIALKSGAFAIARELFVRPYYNASVSYRGGTPMQGAPAFNREVDSLESRNRRLDLKKVSLQAEIAKVRTDALGHAFVDLIQADLLLFLRSQVVPTGYHAVWYPMTLVYANQHGPLETFARCISRQHLSRILELIGGPEDAVRSVITESQQGSGYGFGRPKIPVLAAVADWGKMP